MNEKSQNLLARNLLIKGLSHKNPVVPYQWPERDTTCHCTVPSQLFMLISKIREERIVFFFWENRWPIRGGGEDSSRSVECGLSCNSTYIHILLLRVVQETHHLHNCSKMGENKPTKGYFEKVMGRVTQDFIHPFFSKHTYSIIPSVIKNVTFSPDGAFIII